MNSEVGSYIAEAIYELSKANVKLITHPEEFLHGCVGWYDFNDGEMHVCLGGEKDAWLSTFVHEFQHFKQHRENAECWSMAMDTSWIGPEYADHNCDTLFEALYYGKSRKKNIRSLTPEQRMEIARRVLEVERDCELRTIREIEDRGLPVDLDYFKRDAFRNIASYAVAFYAGEWKAFNKRHLYKVPADLTIDFFEWASDPKLRRMWIKNPFKKRLQLLGNGDTL